MKTNRYTHNDSKAGSRRLFTPAIFFVFFTLVLLFGYFFIKSKPSVDLPQLSESIAVQTEHSQEEPSPPTPQIEYTTTKNTIQNGDTISRLLGGILQPQEILSMLKRIHCAGIHVNVRIQLLNRALESAGLEQSSDGGSGQPFAQRRKDTAGNENEFCFLIVLLHLNFLIFSSATDTGSMFATFKYLP